MARFTLIACKSGRDPLEDGAIRISGCAACGAVVQLDPATHRQWTTSTAPLLICPVCYPKLAAPGSAALEELLAKHRIRFRGRPRKKPDTFSEQARILMRSAVAALRTYENGNTDPLAAKAIAEALEEALQRDVDAKIGGTKR